jgi:hypothetical protein
MTRFVQSEDRRQGVLLPEDLDDDVAEDNPVRVIDVFVDARDLGARGFDGVSPETTGRPADHPGALLKIYVYGDMPRRPVTPAIHAARSAWYRVIVAVPADPPRHPRGWRAGYAARRGYRQRSPSDPPAGRGRQRNTSRRSRS